VKNLSPSQILLVGSLGIVLTSLLTLGVLHLTIARVPFATFIVLPLVLGVISYFLFFLIVRKFINDRLKVLYRSIRKGKITSENDFNFKLSENSIAQAERDTQVWTEEKQKQIVRLQEQAKFRREFLGNLAHELKTPIFSIQGYLLTLLEGGLEDKNVNVMFLERASKATDRMVHLIEDLDLIMKMEVNELPLDVRNFDLKDLVKEIFELLEATAAEKSIALKFEKQYEPIYVTADRAKVSQVFVNLIKNSIAYGNEGGTTTVRFYEVDDSVTIEVSDNGPGIDEKSMKRIFERFYRIEKSRNRNDGGSGLGLSIVKHIIEAHQQTINVRSTEGMGTTFVFTLDATE